MLVFLRALLCLATAAVALTACGTAAPATGGSPAPAYGRPAEHPSPAPTPSAAPPLPILGGPHLVPGSDPGALPGPILIADRSNDRLLIVDPQGRIRWKFPRAGDLRPGETFQVPDDAFFSPDGRQIVVTQEDDFVISVVDVASHRIVYRYGVPGVPGAGPNHLWNPDDAMLLRNGEILAPDIKNCRILLIGPGQHQPLRVFGESGRGCLHRPPSRWGSPNGAFPMSGGEVLVTEINGNWADALDLATGRVRFQVHPPGVLYPSDSNEIRPGVYLTADYSYPGQLVSFDSSGRLLWRYRPRGAGALDHPSLALPLPNGDVLCNDDRNHRVIVIDPRTNQVVWQYGVTGVAGVAPGYLNNPDGVDLVPPFSLAMRFSPGRPAPRRAAASPVG